MVSSLFKKNFQANFYFDPQNTFLTFKVFLQLQVVMLLGHIVVFQNKYAKICI